MKRNLLTFIRYTGKKSPHGHKIALFKCDCGNEKEILFPNFKNGNTKSCGKRCKLMCKHGYARVGKIGKTYYTWINMKARCNQKKTNKNYRWYKNIKVCDRWKKFENFLEDMGEPESIEMSLDRVDNNGNYCKENCRWATIKEQANNKSTSHLLEYKGEVKTIKQWSDKLGIRYEILLHRINNYGWSIERALTTPKLKKWNPHKEKPIYFNGESAQEAGKRLGGSRSMVLKRIKYGWSLERAFNEKIK